MHHSPTRTAAALLCALVLLVGCSTSNSRGPAAARPVPLPPLVSTASADSASLPGGPESMYNLVDSGTLAAANDLLNDVWDVPRYQPVKLPAALTWKEDPYQDSFWRYEFYSLRPTSNLLWAYYTTNQAKYLDKLLSILRSFTAYDVTNPAPDPSRLDNPHSAAFRMMILVDDYVKLTRSQVLPADLSASLKISIVKLGTFLASPRNYQGTYNHGFTEASALLLLAVNFPSLPLASSWHQLALSRLGALMQLTVGADGVEIERSPFYHFYVFDFALQLEDWAQRSGIVLSTQITDRVASMLKYSTDIIWPNGQIPLVGSSVKLKPDGYAQLYANLEKANSQFEFAVTGGAQGTVPDDRATLFPTSGQVIMRSPVDPHLPYSDNSQLVLNGGPASTAHSHLDALAFTYYSDGLVLLPDSGLDTYTPGPTYDFFHGTSAHNTVVVDGQDQGSGTVSAKLVTSGPSWEYASAVSALYGGVTQKRSVLMLGHNLVLVVDSLNSASPHSYQQLWHLFPGADLTMNGSTAQVSNAQDEPVMQIRQAQVAAAPTVQTYYGNTAPMQGWYSEKYGQVGKNHVVGYTLLGATASYLTLIAVGPDASSAASVTGTVDGATIQVDVCAADSSSSVLITNQAAAGEHVAVDTEAASSSGGCNHGN